MIDPTKPTNFNRTKAELQEWLLFCVVVAGKSSFQQAKKLDDFLKLEPEGTPFEKIQAMDLRGELSHNLREVKMGQYLRIYRVFRALMWENVNTLSLCVLESIKGIGPKTARFFFLHSYPNLQMAVLDTHILAWMKEQGYDVPKSTPSRNRYKKIELWFLNICKDQGISPAELDAQIWNSRVKASPVF